MRRFFDNIEDIKSAFGRGESFQINGAQVELLRVTHPSAFQLSSASFADSDCDFMIAINDKIADGRDVSWLWNVDFSSLKNIKVVSGIRAYDMALRLKYDNIKTEVVIEDLKAAVRKFANSISKHKRKKKT